MRLFHCALKKMKRKKKKNNKSRYLICGGGRTHIETCSFLYFLPLAVRSEMIYFQLEGFLLTQAKNIPSLLRWIMYSEVDFCLIQSPRRGWMSCFVCFCVRFNRKQRVLWCWMSYKVFVGLGGHHLFNAVKREFLKETGLSVASLMQNFS